MLRFYKKNATNYEERSFAENTAILDNQSYYINEFLNEFEQPIYSSPVWGDYGFINIDGWDIEYITFQNINNCAICFNEDERIAYTIISNDPQEQFPLAGKLIIKAKGVGEIRIRIDNVTVQTYNINTTEYENFIYEIDVNNQSLIVDFLGDFCVQAIAVCEPSLEYSMCGNEFQAQLFDISPLGATYSMYASTSIQKITVLLDNLLGFPDTITITFENGNILSEDVDYFAKSKYIDKIIQMIRDYQITAQVYDIVYPSGFGIMGSFYLLAPIKIASIKVVSGTGKINKGVVENEKQSGICCIEYEELISEPFIILEETCKSELIYSNNNYRNGLLKDFEYKLLIDFDIRRTAEEESNFFVGQNRNYIIKGKSLNIRDVKGKEFLPDYVCEILENAFNSDNISINGVDYVKHDKPSYDYPGNTTLFAEFEIKLRLSK